eukprot:1447833-Amphidinium_carterae.2
MGVEFGVSLHCAGCQVKGVAKSVDMLGIVYDTKELEQQSQHSHNIYCGLRRGMSAHLQVPV